MMTFNEREVDGGPEEGGYVDPYSIQSQHIKGYMLKGIWYFDKRQGELEYRLLAIAPMGPDVQVLGVQILEKNSTQHASDFRRHRQALGVKKTSSTYSYAHLL